MLETKTKGKIAYTFNVKTKKEKPLRVFEAFAGVGSQRMALENIGANFEVVGLSEWDINSMQSYQAIHGKEDEVDHVERVSESMIDKKLFSLGISRDGKDPMTEDQVKRMPLAKKKSIINHIINHKNMVSISNIDPEKVPDHDLFTYSFPCQDISVVGRQDGLEEDSGTRSSLLWECRKIIKAKKPKYLLMENVKNLVGVKHKDNFDKWLDWLEDQGYKNYWKIIVADECNVPQKRKRVFVVSILDEEDEFCFKEPVELNRSLKDILEDEVDEMYHVPEEIIESYYHKKGDFGKRFAIVDIEEAAFTLTAKSGRAVITNNYLTVDPKDVSKLSSMKGKECLKSIIDNHIPVRALTPLEYWRLMGFSDEAFNRAKESGLSDAMLYKQAGNSIVVNVLEGIFEEMLKVGASE